MNVVQAEVRPRFIEVGKTFRKHFGEPHRIYYPGCGNDITPAIAFPQSHITFLDVEDWRREITKQIPGATVIQMDAKKYKAPQPFDLVIDIHSHAPFVSEIKDLKIGGWLLISNKTSEEAFRSEAMALSGVMLEAKGDASSYVLIKNNLARFEEVEEEVKEISFSNDRKIKAPYYIFRKVS